MTMNVIVDHVKIIYAEEENRGRHALVTQIVTLNSHVK
jgi:hypothetical protein